MSELLPGAPADVAAALERLKVDLTRAAGNNLAGLLVYGGLARGRYRPGKSDVNVVVLLNDASAESLLAIAPALQTARRAAGVDPLLLTPAEVAQVAGAFPIKFLDIKSHHVVLAGADPFAGLEVPRELIRLRIEQELYNMLLRLRHSQVVAGKDVVMQVRTLTSLARPFALLLQSLLQLAGKSLPADDRSASVFDAAAAAFALERAPLAQLADLRQDAQSTGEPTLLYRAVLAAVARATDVARQLKEAPS